MTGAPRVLHIITGLGTGGAETSLLRLLESLGDGARQHRVISLMDRGTLGSAIERTGATLVALGLARGRWGVAPVRRMVAEARTFMPDVLHGWMYHGGLAASVTAALLPGRIPVVWGVRHALDDWDNESPGFRRFFRAMALLSGRPSRIVYNSARSKEQHEARGFRRTRGLVIPNGFDVERFAPDPAAGVRLRSELGIDREAPLVALVARVDPLKDHATFLAAAAVLAARLPAARFVLAGKDTDNNAEIRLAIATHGLNDRVATLGERPDVAAIFNAANIATLTSVSEGFPNVVGEAMACGRACVVTDAGDSAHLVGQTGLVVRPRDPEALANAWHDLLSRSAREDLGARARTRVTEEFALTAVTERWKQLYDDVRSHRKARRVGAAGSTTTWRALHAFTVDMSVRFIEGQATALKPYGVELEVISSPGPELEAIARREGVRVHAVQMARRITPFADLRALRRLMAIIRDRRPDATHAHTPKAGLLLTLAGWLCRVPIRTYHVHGLPWQTARGLRRHVLMLSERVACAAATDIWCVSQSVRNGLVEAGLAASSRATVIGGGSVNGVDAHGAFSPEAVERDAIAEIRTRYGIPAGAPVAGFIGRLVCDKGVRELTAAWPLVRAACPDAHLLVVGPEEAHDPLPADTREQLARLPGVHVHGVDWNTPRLFGAMDLFVLPTYREGFPTVLLEAAAMRRPVVATRVAGCTDAVEDGITGTLVPVRDSARLAAAMIQYLRDPALRATHAAAARLRVEREYDVRIVQDAIATAYAAMRRRGARPRARGRDFVRRVTDISVAAIALIALAPVLLLTAIAVRVALGRPVFFRQARPGLDGRPFTLLKFRTMRAAVDAGGRPLSDARRLTPFGRWLRATSLDELPELWNVLRGDMSLVGPRPLLMQYLPLYSAEQARRHEIRPGITGWAQIHGRNALSWNDRFRHDVWYVDHRSLALDLHIAARTVAAVVTRRGVNAPGEATVAYFAGTCPDGESDADFARGSSVEIQPVMT